MLCSTPTKSWNKTMIHIQKKNAISQKFLYTIKIKENIWKKYIPLGTTTKRNTKIYKTFLLLLFCFFISCIILYSGKIYSKSISIYTYITHIYTSRPLRTLFPLNCKTYLWNQRREKLFFISWCYISLHHIP